MDRCLILLFVFLCGCAEIREKGLKETVQSGIPFNKQYDIKWKGKYIHIQSKDKKYAIGYDREYQGFRIQYKIGF